MNCVSIELTPEQEKIFEFRLYQFQGLQIAVNQFLSTNEFEYNEEHYNRLAETYIDKYRLFNKYLLQLLAENEYKNVAVKNLNYVYVKGSLKVYI